MPSILVATTPTPCAKCPLRQSSTCELLGNGDPATLEAARSRQFTLRAKRLLVAEGDRPSEVFALQSGWGARFRMLANGSRQILSFDLPGDFLSPELLHDAPVRFSKLALTRMVLCAFPRERTAKDMFAHPAKAEVVARSWAQRVHDLEHRVMMLGRMQAAGRIAGLVLDIYRRLKERGLAAGDSFEFPLRHEDLADALGMTPEHVSRTLSALRQNGLLEVQAKRAEILDRNGLQQLASRRLRLI